MSRSPVRLAVLGCPLHYTRSPDLHRAGLEALGLACESEAIRTPAAELPARLNALAERGLRGVNLTNPLKDAALACVPRVSERAQRARSINTVGFENDHWWGDTTDGPGFIDLLEALGRSPEQERVVLLGAGGAARSLALSLAESGVAALAVACRDPERAAPRWAEIATPAWLGWRSDATVRACAEATLIVNATPLEADAMPFAFERTRDDVLLIDLRYGEELMPWVVQSRAAGRTAYDGLGLLVYQARRSLALWNGQDVPVEPLRQAVGWPR